MIFFLNCGHSDNDRDHNDYDDVDCDGVGHSHINSDFDEYVIGD